MAKVDDIEIRRVENMDDFFRIAEIQKQVWGQDSLVVTSPHLVKVHVEMGALVLGAYTSEENIVGFVYSFPGERGGKRIHWSHMLAVVPRHRGTGLGKLLKWKQRDEVLKAGMDICCWTFDPLQAINARLNLVALGAQTDEYIVDAYSTRDGYLDGGLPTDRFVAHWELNHPRVVERARGNKHRAPVSAETLAIACRVDRHQGLYIPSDMDLSLADDFVGVTIPPDINGLRSSHPEIAYQWRLAIRDVLTNYLDNGYCLVDSLTPQESKSSNFIYILQRV